MAGYLASSDSSAGHAVSAPLIVLTESEGGEVTLNHSSSAVSAAAMKSQSAVPASSGTGGTNGKSKTCNMTHGFGAASSGGETKMVCMDVTDASAKRSPVHPTTSHSLDSGPKHAAAAVRRSVGDNHSLVKTVLIDVVPCFRTNKVIQQRWQLFLMALMLCTFGLVALAVTFTVWRMKDSFAYAIVPLALGGLFFIPGVYYLVLMCLVMSSRSRFTLDMLPTME